jgi:predicted ATPase
VRLEQVHISEFKNLKDLRVDFDRASPYTVLVGENGAGKSNFLEAITAIFRSLDLDQHAPFGYSLRYRCRGNELRVQARAGRYPDFAIRTTAKQEYRNLSRRQFMREDERGPLHRPAFVFGYYSGPSDRLAALFERHRERYYEWIIRPREKRTTKAADANTLRRLFYAETLYGQFALLAFFMDSSEDHEADRAFLREHLRIDGLDSVLFMLDKPEWKRKGGDPRFWGAVGDVQQFLSLLYDAALLPARMSRRATTSRSVTSLYLFLASAKDLETVYRHYDDAYSFFTAIESTHLSHLLGEVRTRVRMTPAAGGGEVTYRDLSEGEQQLLLVLGLLKFTRHEEALFILDEPDTHLNPAWSTKYLDFLDQYIADRADCHILISTHDPLVFSGLTRSQVRVFQRTADGAAAVDTPMQDPRGMGIQAILASDLFRLPSGGLDTDTLRDVERQRELTTLEELSDAQRAELGEITTRLTSLDYWKHDRDPLYQLFLERFMPAWTERMTAETAQDTQPSVEKIRARQALVEEIAREVAEQLASEGQQL